MITVSVKEKLEKPRFCRLRTLAGALAPIGRKSDEGGDAQRKFQGFCGCGAGAGGGAAPGPPPGAGGAGAGGFNPSLSAAKSRAASPRYPPINATKNTLKVLCARLMSTLGSARYTYSQQRTAPPRIPRKMRQKSDPPNLS